METQHGSQKRAGWRGSIWESDMNLSRRMEGSQIVWAMSALFLGGPYVDLGA